MEPVVYRWGAEEGGPITEAWMRAKLESLGYRVSRYDYPPGTFFDTHTHAVDKIDGVLAGQFRLVMEGREVVLGPGDAIEVPSGARHSAEVLGSETVVSLDAVKK